MKRDVGKAALEGQSPFPNPSRKPALALEVGCVLGAAVYIEKEPEKTAASKLAPIFSGFFFGVLRTLAEQAPRTAALVRDALECRRFFCGKNEREESAAALWQIKADAVPMRHRVQQALALLHDNAELRAGLLP